MRKAMFTAVMIASISLAGCGHTAEYGTDEIVVQRSGCIDTRCVAAYQQGKAPYWTVQQQHFCPQSVLFEAWGTEPEGAYRCTYTKGQFSAAGLDGAAMKSLPAGLMNAPLAELVYYSFTSGAGFEPAEMSVKESARIEGQQYEAFQISSGSAGRTIMLYKNAVSGNIELVRVADGEALDWMARSYNPRYHDRFKRMIPRRIDVFDIWQGIASKKLLIQFDYIDVQ
jgi:hypothetical protein